MMVQFENWSNLQVGFRGNVIMYAVDDEVLGKVAGMYIDALPSSAYPEPEIQACRTISSGRGAEVHITLLKDNLRVQ